MPTLTLVLLCVAGAVGLVAITTLGAAIFTMDREGRRFTVTVRSALGVAASALALTTLACSLDVAQEGPTGDNSVKAPAAGWKASGVRHGAGAGAVRQNAVGHGRMQGVMMGTSCGQSFDAFDADRDGKLTEDEFANWSHARGDAESLFGDRAQDGAITRAEFCEVSSWLAAS